MEQPRGPSGPSDLQHRPSRLASRSILVHGTSSRADTPQFSGCQDIDDALHARSLPNGNIEAGVRTYMLILTVTHALSSFAGLRYC